ncbi:aminotransferase class I/II-fold pyridoxal phosphate-dependent enzyme [Streptomyces sp. HUAS CX7]|uniref:aminotransferase class I/II-fold pyridoxal phosphate-dependent enzyme n=1 Tax=Streptomyces sp. HUAS CX7 TaxID=3062782 RepID=UPI0026ECB8BF|nr:aminotransferase class I/II-fold pyridoxal phosphate-dependent enzyme [Streptomyces sp. HUAS CX7]WKX23633.1 aminotransferase class I/II-fold pyridoxal phosphate-dependent enzyme [Streptomyces sp. HUAS CX7]
MTFTGVSEKAAADHESDQRNLTSMETGALGGGLNVSDGHPRMPLTDSQRAIVEDLPALFDEAQKRVFEEIEAEAQQAFLHAIGQRQAPIGTGRLVSCYSSSVAMDITARALAHRVGTVALVHPTFDNIPDLLKGRSLTLLPLAEAELEHGEPDLPDEAGAVFVTTPNNPTGWVLSENGLRRLAAFCAHTNRVLAMDTCFRAQDTRAQYDTYAILRDSGAEWVVIEDTGKLWPTLELKAGFLAWGQNTDLPLLEYFSDVLLSVSPLVLLMLTRFAQDAERGGYAKLHRLIARNRGALAEVLDDGPVTLTDTDARISVARLTLPDNGPDAVALYEKLVQRGTHILPCGPFYWDRQIVGARQVRLALARSEEDVIRAARALVDALRAPLRAVP